MYKQYDNHTKGVIALVLLTLVFASMGVFARYLSAHLGLFQQVYSRLFLAFLFSVAAFWKYIRWQKIISIPLREWGVLFIRSTFQHLLGVVLVTAAVLHTKLGIVSLIQTLPLVSILAVAFLKEHLTTAKIWLILLASLGVFVITIHGHSDIGGFNAGDVYAILAAIAFSFGYISRHWHKAGLNNQEITAAMFFISTLTIFIVSLVAGEGLPSLGDYSHKAIILALIGSGVFNVLNLFLSNYGFEHVKAVLAGNILTLEAVFGILLGYLLYQESVTVPEAIGGVLIIASVILMNTMTAEENIAPEAET